MLAYVLWHRSTGDVAAYESALGAFHEALAAAPPPGLARSLALRLDDAPWLPGPGTAYEDWYLVADWAALGDLNAAAVRGPRLAAHDAVAHRAGAGQAGVYAPAGAGAEAAEGPRAIWLDKPAGTAYADWRATLATGTGAPWQRQMTLGPAPEFVLLGDGARAPAGAEGVVVERVVVAEERPPR